MVICGQYFSSETIEWINHVVSSEAKISRSELSRRICGKLDWRSKNKKLKEMSCRKALLRLHKNGLIKLPEVTKRIVRSKTENEKTAYLPKICAIETSLKNLGTIELIAVERCNQREFKIWKALLDKYHYLGSGPLCGAQMRYLVKSSTYGWLGAFAFSAAAWRLSCRDKWITWNEAQRRANLEKVISNSRFLILPQVQVPNLASYLLGRCVKQLPKDWYKRYSYYPVLLETFVEQGRFLGTCYRAANWQRLGATKGRGRQDRRHNTKVAIKDVFVYPLTKDWQKELCTLVSTSAPSLKKELKRTKLDWPQAEFGRSNLGDRRLNRRLLQLAKDFYAKPGANIPQACGSRAKAKAAYRFFDHLGITMEKILKPHYQATTERISEHSIVLAVQDSTSLDYNTHPATEKLGPIGSAPEGKVGLIVHDTMAFSPTGTPLGLLDVQCWARDPLDFGKKARRHQLPIEAKESYKWLKSFKATAAINKQCPQTTIVNVGDREADIYELFALAKKESPGPKVLIRASHNRCLIKEQSKLWEKMAAEPISGIQELYLPSKGRRQSRIAKMAVRFAPVQLRAPLNKSGLKPVKLWAIWSTETNAPAGSRPLQWMLLTDIKITNFKEACEKLGWYSLRWGIEIFHRTLKSGCKIEERQLGCADRIEACLAIDMVVAWRIYHLTKLGRETPDVKCSVFFEEEEWKALLAFVNKDPIPPKKPPNLRTAIRMVAALGGFLGRKSDGEPGTKTTWLGLQRLDDITQMWKVMIALVPQTLKATVSSKTDYG